MDTDEGFTVVEKKLKPRRGGGTSSWRETRGPAACRNGLGCRRWDCFFSHPPSWEGYSTQQKSEQPVPCRDGLACTREDCAFRHE